MKKKSSIILLFVLAIVTSLCFFGCKKDVEPDNPTPTPAEATITLDKTSLNLDVYESAVLNATANNVTETLVWASSNPSVATVDGGKVTAVGAGEATVTVSGSGASATCAVTVTDSHTAPVLRVEHSEIAVALNGTYDLKIETLWKGAAITDPIDYVWSYADGQPEDVVSVENIATGARFTGLKYGSTELYVKADVRGTKLVQKISVKVCNVDITFEIANLTKGETYYEAKVALIETETDPASVTPDVKIYDKQTLVENPVITWTVADDTVANITNGVITALKEGETLAYASYENNDIIILIKAYRPVVTLADNVTVETIDGTFVITSDLEGTISGVTVADESVLSSVSGKNFTLDKAKLPKDGSKLGAQKITIETDKVQYVIDAIICTKAIRTEDDLVNLVNYTATNGSNKEGYFVQMQNISVSAGKRIGFGHWGGDNLGWVNQFNGTYDGQGYTIDGAIQETNAGLFGYMNGGTVKNVVFTNAVLNGNGGFVVTELHGGVIENVAVYGKMDSSAGGAGWAPNSLLVSKGIGGEIKNCLVELSTHPFNGDDGVSAGMIVGILNGTSVKDCVAINLKAGANAAMQAIGTSLNGRTDTASVKTFRDYIALKDSGLNFSAWNSEFWQVVNGIPYPKKLALPEVSTPVATAPATSGVGKDIVVSGMRQNEVIKLSDEAVALGVTVSGNILTVPESVAGGTEITFTVFNIFDDSKKVDITVLIADSEDIDLENRTEIEMQSSDDLVVDLSSYNLNGEVTGLLIENDSKDITNVTFENGILTLPKSALGNIYGNKDIIVNIATRTNGVITKITTVNVPVLAITKILKTADDVLIWNTLSYAADSSKEYWAGYFVLGNDIDMTGKEYLGNFSYADLSYTTQAEADAGHKLWTTKDEFGSLAWLNGKTGGFRGVFDGRGYTIKNITMAKANGSFAGQIALGGVVKNISFTGVTLKPATALISVGGNGTIENIYAEIDVFNGGYSTSDITGVFFARDTMADARVNKCLVVFNCAAAANDYASCLGKYHLGYGILNEVYAVGAGLNKTNIFGTISSIGDTDVYNGFESLEAFKAAGVVNWNNEFWMMVDGIPMSKRVVESAGASITNTVTILPTSQRTLKIESDHQYLVYSLDEAAIAAGLTISGNVVTIPENATVSTFTVTATSMLNSAVKAEKTFYIVSSETIDVTDRKEIEIQSSENATFDLSSYNLNGTLSAVSVDGVAIDLANVTFEDGTLTILNSALTTVYGEKTIVLTFETKSGDVVTKITTVNVPVLAVTKVLKTADDVLNWNTLALAADSSKEYWGGYFKLGNDIDMTGKEYLGNFSYADLSYTTKEEEDAGHTLWTTKDEFGSLGWLNGNSGGFRGVFDGCGYTIKNITMAKVNGSFAGQIAVGGVVKNVSFTGVTLKNRTALISVGGNGTIENIYAEIDVYEDGWSANDITGVLFARDTMAAARVNKCLVVFNCAATGKTYASCLGKYHLGYGQLNGVYAVGAGLTKANMLQILSSDQDDGSDVYDAFETIEALKTAGVANWENDFWTIVNGVPTPKKLVA